MKNNQHRNVSLDKMESAIKKFIDRGYYVIDMGYKDKSILNLNSKKFIRNYRTECNQEIGDIFLPSKSKFFFGADTGANNFHRILNKPQVVINTPDLSTYLLAWFFNKSLLLPKLIYSDKGKIFTFKQMEEYNLIYKPTNLKIEFNKFSLRHNTDDEVEKAAEEILFYIDNGYFKVDKEDKLNLNKLKSFLLTLSPNSSYTSLLNEEFNFIISPYFLKKHSYLLN